MKKTERKLFPFTEKPLYDENKEKRMKKKDPNVGVCNKITENSNYVNFAVPGKYFKRILQNFTYSFSSLS